MKNWFKTNTDSSPKDKKWWKPNISWLKLDKWVKRLDIYIIKKFLGTYFFAIALAITPERTKTAIQFGTAIRALEISERFQTKSPPPMQPQNTKSKNTT